MGNEGGRMKKVSSSIFIGLMMIVCFQSQLAPLSLNLTYLSLIKNPATVPLQPFATPTVSTASPRPAVLTAGVSHQPSAAELRGRMALLNGDVAQAIEYFSRAIALGRKTDINHFQLAQAYARAGDSQSAILHWRAAKASPYFLQRGL